MRLPLPISRSICNMMRPDKILMNVYLLFLVKIAIQKLVMVATTFVKMTVFILDPYVVGK